MIDKLLIYIQKTNPEMTKDVLMDKLKESSVSASALFMTFSCANGK